ncbi:MAG: DUF2007 domain-containing protein [Fimbriimonadaceae bacterium]|nr:DUF2007 domain-containing protein [Chitinophagales bacterium]
MEKDWMMIYSTENRVLFSRIRYILEEEQIKYVCFNKKDSFYDIGLLEIYVHYIEAEKALNIIYNAEHE